MGVADGFENCVNSASRKVDMIKSKAFELLNIYFNMNVQVNLGIGVNPAAVEVTFYVDTWEFPVGSFFKVILVYNNGEEIPSV